MDGYTLHQLIVLSRTSGASVRLSQWTRMQQVPTTSTHAQTRPIPVASPLCCLIVRNPGSDTAATRISSSIVHCPIRSNPSSFPASRHSNILSQSIDQLTAENTSCKSSKRAPYTLPARRHVRSIQHIPWRHCPRRFSPHSVSHPPRR
ncbi:hypothetical protein M440DRAFT_1260395 [Trichoderma longibrachiatum ATCC 18648]|uniref:Uncharacterized protein n=1 Tax=Trichoderma longibrachiatum ATCC 18648 TaxID=983965 RepID=A0A2T4C2F1_TRILO|nr:hypothetical protein M440DRAFT_1260395 [Trichoderma longibrachiatum ATCC 18648]